LESGIQKLINAELNLTGLELRLRTIITLSVLTVKLTVYNRT